jgi:hypothetical protein
VTVLEPALPPPPAEMSKPPAGWFTLVVMVPSRQPWFSDALATLIELFPDPVVEMLVVDSLIEPTTLELVPLFSAVRFSTSTTAPSAALIEFDTL